MLVTIIIKKIREWQTKIALKRLAGNIQRRKVTDEEAVFCLLDLTQRDRQKLIWFAFFHDAMPLRPVALRALVQEGHPYLVEMLLAASHQPELSEYTREILSHVDSPIPHAIDAVKQLRGQFDDQGTFICILGSTGTLPYAWPQTNRELHGILLNPRLARESSTCGRDHFLLNNGQTVYLASPQQMFVSVDGPSPSTAEIATEIVQNYVQFGVSPTATLPPFPFVVSSTQVEDFHRYSVTGLWFPGKFADFIEYSAVYQELPPFEAVEFRDWFAWYGRGFYESRREGIEYFKEFGPTMLDVAGLTFPFTCFHREQPVMGWIEVQKSSEGGRFIGTMGINTVLKEEENITLSRILTWRTWSGLLMNSGEVALCQIESHHPLLLKDNSEFPHNT